MNKLGQRKHTKVTTRSGRTKRTINLGQYLTATPERAAVYKRACDELRIRTERLQNTKGSKDTVLLLFCRFSKLSF